MNSECINSLCQVFLYKFTSCFFYYKLSGDVITLLTRGIVPGEMITLLTRGILRPNYSCVQRECLNISIESIGNYVIIWRKIIWRQDFVFSGIPMRRSLSVGVFWVNLTSLWDPWVLRGTVVIFNFNIICYWMRTFLIILFRTACPAIIKYISKAEKQMVIVIFLRQ